MNLLVFDSSTATGSVAVIAAGVVRAELTLSVQRTHSEHLMPAVAEVVALSGLNVRQLEAIGVGTGPGSYTGIRIALGTALGLGYALQIPVVGISTLDILAAGLWPARGEIIALLDARKNEVYCGVYRCLNTAPYLERQHPLQVVTVERLPELLTEETALFVGPGALLHRQEVQGLCGQRAVFAPAALAYPQALRLGFLAQAKLAQGLASFDPTAVQPIYLRRAYV